MHQSNMIKILLTIWLIIGIRAKLEPVHFLNLPAFSGRWYQMYASLLPTISFQMHGMCITTDYSIRSAAYMEVRNSQNKNTPNGLPVVWDAVAVLPNPQHPGQWLLTGPSFFTGNNRTFPFWILAVAPQKRLCTKYNWAVIGGSFGVDVYILARDAVDFKENHERTALELVDKLGFNKFYNSPIATYQGSDCEYRKLDDMPRDEDEISCSEIAES